MTDASGQYRQRDHALNGWATCANWRCERWVRPEQHSLLCGPCQDMAVAILGGLALVAGVLWWVA